MKTEEKNLAKRMSAIAGELESCRSVFLAIGDENRQHIIIALLENYGGMRVGQLTEKTSLSRPAVSHHLKILKDAGLVSMFKRGTKNFYHMDANESQWEQITALMNDINSLVKEVTVKSKSGSICCGNNEE
ncbi:MAG: ArsR/SmtB family transcription factor [Lachnospiraceae bacterium]